MIQQDQFSWCILQHQVKAHPSGVEVTGDFETRFFVSIIDFFFFLLVGVSEF